MNSYLFPILTDETGLPFYVKGVGGLENQNHIVRPNGYHEYQWLHCLKGKGNLLVGGKEYSIPANTGFFLSSGVPHEYYGVETPWETHWVTFEGGHVIPLLNTLGLGSYNVFYLEDVRTLDHFIRDIFTLSQSKTLLAGHKASAKLYGLLMDLKYLIRENEETADKSRVKKLQPLLSYLDANYYRNPTIEEMAGRIGVSPQYLCRIFKQVVNMRPFTYLNLLKLQKAKELLLGSLCLSVGEISASVGYNDTSYFCETFKKYEGITPTEFRASYRTI